MLDGPKGLIYWIDTEEGSKISKDAPEWAKKEFEEYQEYFNKSKDKNGNLIDF
ncbi:hypothetical protein FC72_GL000320 [Companilactobacillus tucceti DSM 20183]|uniref:Uncharacterized protein n=1 Tax=Companilactobacillus tucceti DSM 20183 TaxID=1423811 RepID=A0A0R1J835_9LACO|nr:hypothetical protein [Companilactobacillus tucceti]KRK64593.1 hypothetical protein FC72_GL000320 [Companilactobacillus tucceti DSM 20183]